MKLFSRKLQLGMIDTSSRMALKLSCIAAAHGDVQRAQTLYAFLSEGITELPDFTAPAPSLIQQAAHTLKSAFTFVKDNRDDIAQALSYVQSLRQSHTVSDTQHSSPSLPPLPDDATAQN